MKKTNLQLGSFVANVKMETVCVKIGCVKIGKGGGGQRIVILQIFVTTILINHLLLLVYLALHLLNFW
ncbi:MAG: hypothetical protein LBT09_15000 [Planctomycetaceae bacterium]|nr:hypothetical protein [Planctomycetaceae bacterium]